MKFHWGHGVLITIILIVITFTTALILSLNKDVQLVTKDYYAKELAYEGEIERISRAKHANVNVLWTLENGRFRLQMTGDLPMEQSEGTVVFFRPSDKALDREFELELDSTASQYFDPAHFTKGTYQMQVTFEIGGKEYYFEKHIFIP